MYKITLLTVGTLKEQWAKDASRMYRDRLKSFVDFQVMELSPSRQPHASGQQVEESQRLLVSAEKMKGKRWVLDETGKEMTSQEFAQIMQQMQDTGEPVTFIMGGSFGLTDAVRNSADRIVSLSGMTFPHELCRVIFLEQLYRAYEINKGSGYHH